MFLRLNGILFLLLVSMPVFALPEDPQQLIHITADSSQFNYKNGKNIYEGHVIIDQGSTHLLADRVTTQNNAQHKIIEAIAYGLKKPAVYTTVPKKNDAILEAKASTITFYPPKFTIILQGNVFVTQGENSFHGPLIIYNTKDQIITTPPSSQGSATIVVKPT